MEKIVRRLHQNSQAHDSIIRIEQGLYIPDASSVGMTFEDGSRISKSRLEANGWYVSNCVKECICDSAPLS